MIVLNSKRLVILRYMYQHQFLGNITVKNILNFCFYGDEKETMRIKKRDSIKQ